MLRAGKNRDRAARGIRDNVMEDPREATSRQPLSVVFCGVGKKVLPSATVGGAEGGPVHDGNNAAGSSIQPQEGGGERGRKHSYKGEVVWSWIHWC